MDASTTRSPLTPRTLSFGSTTASGSEAGPILHVPTWWCRFVVSCPMEQPQYASDPNVSCSQPGNGTDNNVDPYFWNAWVLLTAMAYNIIICNQTMTKINAIKKKCTTFFLLFYIITMSYGRLEY